MTMLTDKNHWADWFAIAIVLIATVTFGVGRFAPVAEANSESPAFSQYFLQKMSEAQASSDELTLQQTHAQIVVMPPAEIHQRLKKIESEYANQNYVATQIELDIFSQKVQLAKGQINSLENQRLILAKNSPHFTQPQQIPILMYHKTPGDFAAQLDALKTKGYTTITMAELADFFDGIGTLPSKPAVITFDDGFADQMQAFELLKQYGMKATYYLIIGGEKSQWCIGILRHNQACGDSYLNWQQVHRLKDSGIIEIGAHTVDHADLPGLSAEEQNFEISSSKTVLERELGLPITTLAYPYGKFNEELVAKTRQAGFRTAVTTIDGTTQSAANRHTLNRVRNALLLP